MKMRKKLHIYDIWLYRANRQPILLLSAVKNHKVNTIFNLSLLFFRKLKIKLIQPMLASNKIYSYRNYNKAKTKYCLCKFPRVVQFPWSLAIFASGAHIYINFIIIIDTIKAKNMIRIFHLYFIIFIDIIYCLICEKKLYYYHHYDIFFIEKSSIII